MAEIARIAEHPSPTATEPTEATGPTAPAQPTAAEGAEAAGGPGRRALVAGVGVAGLAAALAACGGSSDKNSAGDDSSAKAKGGTGGGQAASPSPSGGGGAASGTKLAKTSAIPEGGGTIFKDQKVVVTQPKEGTYKAFSSICTHRGCPVTSVSDGMIICPCHMSKFRVADGSVVAGPATTPLPAVDIKVEGGYIELA
jgi:nitrite reductase/ring-hydroxylating ferredoxin subunit